MSLHRSNPSAVSFDLFDTLVSVDLQTDPASAIANALKDRGITVPSTWAHDYYQPQFASPEYQEIPLTSHVHAILKQQSPNQDLSTDRIRGGVHAAFDVPVQTHPHAKDVIRAASMNGPVCIISNCSVDGLVQRTLQKSEINEKIFDTIITSVTCGWRKPHPRIFQSACTDLHIQPSRLIHVGDDPETDSGVKSIGGTSILLSDCDLSTLEQQLAAHADSKYCQ